MSDERCFAKHKASGVECDTEDLLRRLLCGHVIQQVTIMDDGSRRLMIVLEDGTEVRLPFDAGADFSVSIPSVQ